MVMVITDTTMDIMAITMDFMVFIMDTMDTTMVKQQDLSSEWRIYLTLDCRTFQIQSSIKLQHLLV